MATGRGVPGVRLLDWQIYGTLLLFVFVISTSRARAAENPNGECLACHEDKTLSTQRGGRTVSLSVDPKRFAASVHKDLSCTSCHAALEGKDLPHETPVAKVDCGTCHTQEAEQHAKSLHGRAVARGDALAPRCVTCHGNHDILAV